MKILEVLEKCDITLTEEQKAALLKHTSDEVISVAESNKKLNKVQEQLDNVQEKLTNTEEALKAFDGVDAEGLKKQIADLTAENAKKDEEYAKKLEARDYKDAVDKLTEGIKFTSNAAKKAFITDLINDPLQMRDGHILGFEDYLNKVKADDPASFVTEEDENKATFTTPAGATTDDKKAPGAQEAALRAAMGLPAVEDKDK